MSVVLVQGNICFCVLITDRAPIKDMTVWPHDGQLFVEWKHDTPAVSEYVIEWVSDGKIDWQRENKSTRQTVIKGNVFVLMS